MALLPDPPVNPDSPITPEETHASAETGLWSDNAALKLVVQDAVRAETYEATKQWVAMWPQATMAYQSPVLPAFWEGTQVPRANIPFFVVAKAVNSLVPQIVRGLFYESRPFMIEPRPGTSSQAARAMGDVDAFQLEDMGFKQELRRGVQNAVLYGTNIWKYGWEAYTRERSRYRRKNPPVTVPSGLPGVAPVTIENDEEDQFEIETIEEQVAGPFFENIVNLRHVLVDPGLNVPDIRRAKFVVHRMYLDWEQLEELRERPGVNLPSKSELEQLFFPPAEEPVAAESDVTPTSPLQDLKAQDRFDRSSANPLSGPLEVLERWDRNTNIMVLQRKLVIMNDENPYGVVPYLSVNWWDVPEAFYGMGLAKTIGAEQRLQSGITNTWLDNVSLNLNGVYTRVRGKSVPTQNIRVAPGRVIEVENKDDLNPLKRLDAVPEAAEHLSMSQQRAEEISGATSGSMMGIAGATGHSNMARSAAGVNMLAAGAGSQVEDFIDKLVDQVFIPFLNAMHEMNSRLLPIKVLKSILNDELEHDFLKAGGDILDLLNARVKFSTLAGAKLMARRNMAQALPIMIQFLSSQPIQQGLALEGKKIDVQELVRMIFEVSDWRNVNDVILPMTDEDKQRWQMTQPAAAAQVKSAADAKTKMALLNQQHQNNLETLNDKNIARAANDVLRQTIEQSAKQEEVQGEPTGPGFGANA